MRWLRLWRTLHVRKNWGTPSRWISQIYINPWWKDARMSQDLFSGAHWQDRRQWSGWSTEGDIWASGNTSVWCRWLTVTQIPQRDCAVFYMEISKTCLDVVPDNLHWVSLLEQDYWTKWLMEDPTNIMWFYDKAFLTFKNHKKWKKRNNEKITVIPKFQQCTYEWSINILFSLREEKSRIHILFLTYST